jgi:hypothetical protein
MVLRPIAHYSLRVRILTDIPRKYCQKAKQSSVIYVTAIPKNLPRLIHGDDAIFIVLAAAAVCLVTAKGWPVRPTAVLVEQRSALHEPADPLG